MKRTLFVALLAVTALSLAGYAVAQTNTHAPRPYYVSPDEPSPGVPPDYAATASDDPNSPVQGGSPSDTTGTPSDTTGTYGSGNAGSPGAAGATGSQGTSSYQGTSGATPSGTPDPTAGTTGTYGSTTGTTGSTYGTTGSTMDPNDPNNPNNPNVTGTNAPAGRNTHRLPATAGEMPLVAFIGALAAGLFFALRLFRTQPIEFRG